ncbi:MAG: 50S ribosomal protein L25 [Syntrophomonadaceae bacterium]|nr:50S ribosomal protein L25 [Syntrophomonadaceae bacterium]MDD3889742.1 50S ribosomal protein L25 [Syntrophomonadaceae bacterium]MDD4548952.1 50S ribosomal protein L25 [Syntrophomonadaceae bacterium]
MAIAQKIAAKKREIKSKGYLNEKRQEWIPGVLYGKDTGNTPVFLGRKELSKTFTTYGSRGLFSLELEGEAKPFMVLVRELQRNPLSGQINHVDFLNVNMNETIKSMVGIHIIGEEEIIKKEGILQLGAKEIEVSCLPIDIPEIFECSVADLEIGEKVTVADLKLPDNVEVLSDLDTLLATVLAPSMAVDDETETEGEDEESESAEETDAEEAPAE